MPGHVPIHQDAAGLQPTPVSDEDIRAAALQYVRKLSGYRQPAQRNAAAFEAAVDEVAAATRRLLDGLTVSR